MEYSQETRKKMSEAKKKFFAEGGKPWNKSETTKNCQNCGNEFKCIPSRLQRAKFCSIDCAKGHNVFDKGNIPWNKGKPHMRGEDHPNWKGGVDKEHTRIKQTSEYKEWQQAVYRKDRWTCNDCNKHCKKGDISAHHIKPFATHKELRFKVSNGIVLCRSCHVLRHLPRRKDYKSKRIVNANIN